MVVFLTPSLTYLYANTVIEINFWEMFFSIIKIVILPLLIGFSLKHFSPQTALVPAIFATWCVITASLLARYWGREAAPFRLKHET